jgi:hypothetical protein
MRCHYWQNWRIVCCQCEKNNWTNFSGTIHAENPIIWQFIESLYESLSDEKEYGFFQQDGETAFEANNSMATLR